MPLRSACGGLQAALVYDEPEPLRSRRHWLGAALVESKRFDEAEKAYRTELQDHPHNGWSPWPSRRSQAGTITDVDGDLASSWSRADTWIRSSRF